MWDLVANPEDWFSHKEAQITCGNTMTLGTKVCLGYLGHMTKMVAMPMYGKNLFKIFFLGTKGPMTLWLEM